MRRTASSVVLAASLAAALAVPEPQRGRGPSIGVGENRESGYYPGGSGNSYYCSNCRYDFDQANYCCSSNIDRDCCYYVNGGGASGGGGYYPGSGSGSYDKPGQCPSNSFGRRRKREENPYQYGNNGPAYRPGGGNGGRHHGNSRCYSDRDCPGSQKCCRDYYGQTRCTYPTYYG